MKRQSEFRYSKLASILREQILSGFIKPGEFLMSENQLSKHYQLSRTSVRKSLDELLKEGLIVKKAGLGTIVSPELKLHHEQRKVLRIIANSPSHFVDTSMSMLIDHFQQNHPNVEVKLLNFPRSDFWNSLRESRDMGLEPDLLLITDQQFQQAAFHQNEFIDLKEVLGARIGEVYPKMTTAFTRNGQLNALPITFSTVYLAYNPALFQAHGVAEPKTGWNKEDFMQTAKLLTMDTDGDGITDQYGFSLTPGLSRWPVIALQNQVRFRAKPTTKLFSGTNLTSDHAANTRPPSDLIAETLDFIHDLVYRKRVATLFRPVRNLESHAFVKRKAAMVLTTSIEMAGWRNWGMNFTSKVAPLPFGPHKSTLLVSNAFALPASANEPELALLFLNHIYSEDIQRQISMQSKFLSIFHSINEQVWSQSELESLNLANGDIGNSYFVHELFPDPQIVRELESEMELYWAGLENAKDVALRLLKLLGE